MLAIARRSRAGMGVDNVCLRVKAYVTAGQGSTDNAGNGCQEGRFVQEDRFGFRSCT